MKKENSTSTKSVKPRKPKVYQYSEKTPYKSIYKEGYVTPSNYIAEIIFKKRSEYFNQGRIPERFWAKGSKLHGAYKGEVIAAAKLLKEYSAQAIIMAINSPDSKYILKISTKEHRSKMIPIIKKCEKEITKTQFNPSSQETSTHLKAFGTGKNKLEGL